MNLLFAHDHRFLECNGVFYSPGKLHYAAYSRYLEYFSSVDVVARSDGRDTVPAGFLRADGLNVRVLPFMNLSSPKGLVFRHRARRRIIKLLKTGSYAGVVVRLPSEIGFEVAKVAYSLNIPVAAEVVGDAWDAMYNHGSGYIGKLYAPLYDWRMRRAVKGADAAVYVTKRVLQERYPSFGLLAGISNVNISVPAENPYRAAAGKSRFRIGLIGGLDAGLKGHDTALAALEIVRRRGIDASLSFVGEGGGEEVRGLVRKMGLDASVAFEGVMRREQLVEWFDSLDLYIQPSRQEGLSRASIEAMSRGVPVVCSNVGGMSEIARSDLLIEPGDYSYLADIIIRLLGSISDRCNASDHSFSTARGYDSEFLTGMRSEFWREFYALCK